MINWEWVLEGARDADRAFLKDLAQLSAGRTEGWEVVEDGGRYLLRSDRWFRGISEGRDAKRRAQDLLDAITGMTSVLNVWGPTTITLGNSITVTDDA